MDRVRLGRVLGRGARLAAQTAYQALDAAAAPSPQRSTSLPPRRPLPGAAQNTPRRPGPSPRSTAGQGVQRRPAGMFAPFRRATHSVSLEVTGSFFALFALSFALGAWHGRDQLRDGPQGMVRLLLFCAVTGFFAYCSISSFVRARRLR